MTRHFIALVILSIATFATGRASADADSCPEPGLILIVTPAHPRVHEPSLRLLIAEDIGYSVYPATAHPGCPMRGTLRITTGNSDSLRFRFTPADETQEPIERTLELPAPGNDPIPVMVSLAANLVRNQADELLPREKQELRDNFDDQRPVPASPLGRNYFTVATGAEIGREPRLDGQQEFWAVPMLVIGGYRTDLLGPVYTGGSVTLTLLKVFRFRGGLDLYYEPIRNLEVGIGLGLSIAVGTAGELPIRERSPFEYDDEDSDNGSHFASDFAPGARFWFTDYLGISAFTRWMITINDGFTLGHQALPRGAIAWSVNLSAAGRFVL